MKRFLRNLKRFSAIHPNSQKSEFSTSYKESQSWYLPNLNSIPFGIILTLVFLLVSNVHAQVGTLYSFGTHATGSLIADRNGTDIPAGLFSNNIVAITDDATSAAITFGFTFTYNGTGYTTFSASTNGGIQLGGVIGAAVYGTAFPTANPIIAPYLGDLTATVGSVKWQVVGTSPSRCLVIQFSGMGINYGSSVANGTFQARLYENSRIIEFVYGAMAVGATSTSGGSTSVAIGIANATGANNNITVNQTSYASTIAATPTINTNSTIGVIAGLNSTADNSRRTFVFAPIATKLTLSGMPATGFTGTPISSFTVLAQNGSTNETNPNFTSTVTITKTSGSGAILGTLTAPCIAGVATFNNVAFGTAGTYTITAAASGLTSALSGNITISNPSTNVSTNDGLNWVGSNQNPTGYSQPINCTYGDYRVLQYRKVNTTATSPTDGRGQWVTTVNAQTSGGNVFNTNLTGGGGNGFVFTSGGGCGSSGNYANKWNFGGIGVAALDAVNGMQYVTSGGNDMGLNMSTAGRYTFVFKDAGYTTTGFYVGYTANAPVTIAHNQSTQRTQNSNGTTTIIATLSTTKSAQENIYIRYKTGSNDFSTGTSTISAAGSVSGTTATLSIPVQTDGATVYYYVFSSTMSQTALAALSEGDKSYALLNFADNAGSNYNYTALTLTPSITSVVPTAVTGITGQATNTGYKGQTITINGTNFQSNATVTINGVAATSVSVVSTTQITAVVANSGANFSGNVIVANPTLATSVTFPSFGFFGYITSTAGTLNTATNWLGGTAPIVNSTVTLAHSQTLNSTTSSPLAAMNILTGISMTMNGASGVLTVSGAITTIGTGTLAFTTGAGNITAGSIINAGTVSWTAAGVLTISSGGTITNNGTVTSGTVANVLLAGAATINGTNAITFNNLTINGTTTLTTVPTINGTLQITSGNVTASPNYGPASTLYYNVATYNRFLEWASTTANPGYPFNVMVGSVSQGCAFNLQNSVATQLRGALTIGAASGATSTFTMNELATGTPKPLTVLGNVAINSTGTLTLGNFKDLSNVGDFNVGGNWTRLGTFVPNSRLVTFSGTAAQTLTGATTFDYITINNSTGLTLNNAVAVSKTLSFTSGRIILGTNTLTVGNTGLITGGSTSSYALTASTGKLIKQGVGTTSTLFPVGFTTTNYTPISLTNTTGTSDLSVGVKQSFTNAVANASKVVTLEWIVTSSAATTATVSPTWVAATPINQGTTFTNTGTGELANFTSSYVTYPVTLNTTTTTATGVALASGTNLLVVGNTGAVVAPPPANNNCIGAIAVIVNAAPITGTVAGATQSIAPVNCLSYEGDSNDDVWYSFTTTGAGKYVVTVDGDTSFDAVIDFRSGACNGANIACADGFSAGTAETITDNALLANTTYYVRVYDFEAGYPITPTFTIGVAYFPPPAITSFPASGCVGNSLVITGTNLIGTTAVTIGGNAATITAVTATTVTVTIVANHNGIILLTTPNGTATSVTSFAANPLPTTTWASAAIAVCNATTSQTTSLAYTATTGAPTSYSIVWNAVPTNSFATVADQPFAGAPGGGTIAITVPANASAGTYTGTIRVKNTNNCSNAGQTFTITVNAAPPVTTGIAICAGASGTVTSSTNCGQVSQAPIIASGTGGTSESTTFGGTGNTNITISIPTLPVGAVVTSTKTTISFATNGVSYLNELRVRATPPTAVGSAQELQPSTIEDSGSITNVEFGVWSILNPSGNWIFAFRESTNDSSPNPDANITNITITVNYTLPSIIQWYANAAGGSPIGNGASFNPVAAGVLANTNTPGIHTYYAACSLNATCRTPATVTIDEAPAAGTITGGGAFCSSANTILAATGTTGNIQWQSSTDGNTYTNIAGQNGTTYNANNISNTMYYRISVSSGSCNPVLSSPAIVMLGATVTWNGSAWTPSEPIGTSTAVISGPYNQAANITACSLTISPGAVVNIPSGYNVNLNGKLTMEGNGSFTLQNNANLLQATDVANSGNIIVKRNSSLLLREDYTLWSSPVAAQDLRLFSPSTVMTPISRYYTYNTLTNAFNSITSPSGTPFARAKGYLIRVRANHTVNEPGAIWTGTFTGVPFNGAFTYVMDNFSGQEQPGQSLRYNLVGNPYPSPIDAITFVDDNAQSITGQLYFWRKRNDAATPTYSTWVKAPYDPANGIYERGTFVTSYPQLASNPKGIIQTGQGFFVEAIGNATNLQFKNTQRVADNANQFFRNATTAVPAANEYHRLWLNATNAAGAFCQTAIGYFVNATNGLDTGLDAMAINDGPVEIYTKIDTQKLAIQGRTLPFDDTDVVPLGFKASIAGTYSIALDHMDGLFTGSQDVYLKDNLTTTSYDLKAAAYIFATAAGTFEDRFEIVYRDSTLGINNPVLENAVVIYKQGDRFVINSGNIIMDNVQVYDIRGRRIVVQNAINAFETSFTAGDANQVLIVKITSDVNQTVTKRVVN